MAMIKSQLVAGNIRGAISTCDAQPVGTTKIIAAGLRKAEQGGAEHEIQQAMDEEALRELPKIEKRTGYLAMLGNLATLCGLLGTITGLIKSFASVAGVDPSMKATMLWRPSRGSMARPSTSSTASTSPRWKPSTSW
jgi:biopolymer transport protein ExbB